MGVMAAFLTRSRGASYWASVKELRAKEVSNFTEAR
jgi:hypothetical protein